MCCPCTALNDRNCRSKMDKKDNHEQSASTNRSATKRQSRPSSGEPELLRLQGIGPRLPVKATSLLPRRGNIQQLPTGTRMRINPGRLRALSEDHKTPTGKPHIHLNPTAPMDRPKFSLGNFRPSMSADRVCRTNRRSQQPLYFLLGRLRHAQLTRWTARASSCWIDRSDPVHNFLIRLRFHGCLCVLTFLLGDGRQSERHSTGDQAGTTSPSSQGSDQFRNMATIWLKSNARRLIASRHPQDAMGALFGQTHDVIDYGIVARLIDLELYEAALGRQQGQNLCSGW